MFTFNLVDEKWIPCIMPGGTQIRLGLSDVFSKASDIIEISDQSPLVTVAVHRLLLAITHRSFKRGFGPVDKDEWKKLWDNGTFELPNVYLSLWRHRFDLFDAVHPFYQWVSSGVKSEPAPIDNLLHESAIYLSKATLFDHNTESYSRSLAPDEVARAVLAFQNFAVGGFGGLSKPRLKGEESAKAAPLLKGAVCLLRGKNLFETLMLNLHVHSPADGEPFAAEKDDKPAWERDVPTIAADRRPKGYLDLLTWQSRCIQLLPEKNETGQTVVRNALVRKGNQFPESFWFHGDPMLAFRKAKNPPKGQDPWPPVAFQEERAMWRDSLALFQSVKEERARPKMLDWLNDLCLNGMISQSVAYDLSVMGLITDRASISMWRHERLPLPLRYLEDDRLIARLKETLDLAEEAGRLLGSGFVEVQGKDKRLQVPAPMRILAQEILPKDQNGKVDPDAARALVDSLSPSRPYWATLGILFNRLVTGLAGDKSADGEYGGTLLPWWTEEVRKAAWQAFREATDSLDHSGRWLRAVTLAENNFGFRLNTIVKEFLEPYQESEKKGGEL